jgi:hypothetical protein
VKERVFLASLSDLNHDSNDSSSSSRDKELERWVKDRLNRLCFLVDTTRGLCTMALGDDVVGSNNKDASDGSISEDRGLENMWLMDSGCSHHMTRSSRWFSSLDPMIGKEYIIF